MKNLEENIMKYWNACNTPEEALEIVNYSLRPSTSFLSTRKSVRANNLSLIIADHHSRFNLLSKLLFSISNKLIDRLSVFSGPAVIFFLPLCVG